MTERELQRAVMNLAKTQGWQCAHFGNTVKIVRKGDTYKTIPDKDAKGFPDLVMLREGRVVVAELKGEKGKVSPEQAIWIGLFREAKIDAFIWKPKDWDEIVKVLW